MYRQILTHTKNGKDKPRMNSKWNFWWCCTNGGTAVLFASSCLFCVCVCVILLQFLQFLCVFDFLSIFVAIFVIFMCFWFSLNFCCNFWVYWFFSVTAIFMWVDLSEFLLQILCLSIFVSVFVAIFMCVDFCLGSFCNLWVCWFLSILAIFVGVDLS